MQRRTLQFPANATAPGPMPRTRPVSPIASTFRLRARSFLAHLVGCPVLRPVVFALALLGLALSVRPSFAEWQLFTPGSGAEAQYVSTICEDRKGDLWFGGVKVSRYDGVRWQNYSLGHTNSFPFLAVVREDREGALWFVEYGWGVTRFDGTNWQLFREGSGIPLADVTTVAIDTRGDVWVGADRGGVCRWDGTQWQGYPELANHSVMFSLADRHGNVWFATYVRKQGLAPYPTYALIRYDGTSMRTMTTADGIPAEWMSAMCEDDHGNVWFAYYTAGLIRYDGTSIHPGRDHPDRGVTAMIADHEDNLWMATENRGVVQLRPDGSWRRITTADGLASNDVSAMHVDRRGNLWFANALSISRWDGTSWRTFRRPELPFDYVETGLQDRSGDLWIAPSTDGVYRYDGVGWRSYSTADGIPPSTVRNILQDRSGNLWFGGSGGLARYDGSVWEDYADSLSVRWASAGLEDREGRLWFVTNGEVFGLPTVLKRYDGTRWETVLPPFTDLSLRGLVEDRDGNLWFGLGTGVARYDGANWVAYTTADGLPSNDLLPALKDRNGRLWFQSSSGPVSFDGSSWRLHSIPTTANGYVNSIREDRHGHLWVATDRGLSRYDGQNWGTYFTSNGLADDRAWRLVTESSGAVWVGCQTGMTRFEPDLVPPQTVAVTKPPALSPNRVVSAAVLAAFGESHGIGYSFRFDAGAWSDWAAAGSWLSTDVADGSHLLEARTRDQIGNVDPHPVSMAFEIDASPPIPVITSPASGAVVRGVVEIRGTSSDVRFRQSTVTFRRAGEPTFRTLARSDSSASDASLATWDTDSLPDGRYEIRLAVEDTLGLTGTAIVAVDVQRNPSTRIVAVDGGEVRSAGGDLRVSFPPRAFREDAVVRVVPLTDGEVPATLPGGATRVRAGARLDWGDAVLDKEAALEMSFASVAPSPSGALTLYGASGETWRRIGGTVDPAARTISTRITGPGAYALFAESVVPSGTGGLSDVALTPRVFSPRGGYAGDRIAISFTLGRAAAVSVRIHNRAGRLVRTLADGEPMGPGTNLVRWDGRDRDAAIAADGLYLVTIEALGERRTSTLAVVR